LKEWAKIGGSDSTNIGITYKKLDTYKAIFKKLDVNGDGFVDIYEINANFRG